MSLSPLPARRSQASQKGSGACASTEDLSSFAMAALPPRINELIELFTLEGRGETVVFPDNMSSHEVYHTIVEFFSPFIEQQPTDAIALPDGMPLVPQAQQPEVDLDNLEELVSLAEIGEPVVWPADLSLDRARQILSSHP